ncbi:Hsp20/alpha crystallin family protein [Pseudoduganella buxea]|uniref:Heat-shock protein 20 n=1 Tax=Pseudoduganella buxea TaxID=1949069 RepID=A0A6I3T2W0_9BURK|nr:Hsp20/alpha crystallin family protein [Pseudoduganella buxea]MTV55744.1 Hsp20 family protein [Pseudoduganella buxea]GGC13361.1 heat-shock protein 20 [Pseudoduganella buxea]
MANLTRYDPFASLASFAPLRDFEDLWRDMRRLPGDGEAPTMRLDVSENDTAYTVTADVPGVKKEDIKVDVDGNQVTITAEVRKDSEQKDGDKVVRSERYVGQQYRSFTLAHAIDDAAAAARYDNGVLQLTLPKKTPGGGRKLQIA